MKAKKASEIILKLARMIDEHGDLVVEFDLIGLDPDTKLHIDHFRLRENEYAFVLGKHYMKELS